MPTVELPDKTFLRLTKRSTDKFSFVAGTCCPLNYKFLLDVQVEGDLTVGTGSSNVVECEGDVIAFASSDARFKDNVTRIENPLEKIQQIRGVNFTWNEEAPIWKYRHKDDVGVIAQEVEQVLPEVVRTNVEGHKQVRYDRIVPLLIEAINEQQLQIKELQTKLEALS